MDVFSWFSVFFFFSFPLFSSQWLYGRDREDPISPHALGSVTAALFTFLLLAWPRAHVLIDICPPLGGEGE
jgi:hypothetical protein